MPPIPHAEAPQNTVEPVSRSTTRRQRIFRVATLTLSLLLALGIGEIACRVLVPPRPPIRFSQDTELLSTLGLNQFAEILLPDSELFWRLPPGRSLPDSAGLNAGVIANAQGLREDHDIPYAAPAGQTRVLFLGDSCTFGAGASVQACYVSQTERLLNEHLPGAGAGFECINAGVPGYTLYQGWRFWETEGRKYNPSLVVVCFGFNDMLLWDGRSDLEHAASEPPGILRSSRVCQLFYAWWSRPGPDEPRRPRLLPEEFKQVLERLLASTRARGADMMVLSWAMRAQVMPGATLSESPYQEVMRQFSEEHHVPLVDLMPVFHRLCREHRISEVYHDGVHSTPLANAAVGAEVAAAIEKWQAGRSAQSN